MKCRHCLRRIRKGVCDCRTRTLAYLPTAAQIRAGCLLIQDGWTEDEERKRRAYQIDNSVRVRVVPAEINED